MKTGLKKILCLLLLFGICFSMIGAVASADSEEEELKKKMEELQKQLDELNEQIKKAQKSAKEAKERAKTLSARIAVVKEQVSTLQQSIDLVKDKLAVKQVQLDAKQMEYEENYELFKQRLKAMYMNNNVSNLSLILGSRTFSEFLVAASSQSKISKHDTDIVDRLDREAKEIESEKAVIQEELDSLEKDMDTLESKYNELAYLYREENSNLEEAEALEKASEEEREAALKALEETKAEWEALMGKGMPGYVGGETYIWPVPGFPYISSKFGWRKLYGKDNYHTGIDICGGGGKGIYGAPIIASNTGQVVRAKYYTTGYGYHVMIDHGDNNWTVYGHMSSIAVKEGEWVTQGQVIGYVGSTGNSTGPHLHFEVRINGTAEDPLKYVSYS